MVWLSARGPISSSPDAMPARLVETAMPRLASGRRPPDADGRAGCSRYSARSWGPDGVREPTRVQRIGPARVHRLDAIRGALAIGVMLYHVIDAPLEFGTYGVYGFFMLSGFALDHVYRNRLDLRSFVVARVTRLAPLWVPVVLLSAAPFNATDPVRLGLNLTGLFGFVNPAVTSHVDGGWSIGIEVVFYFLFPLLTVLSTRMLVALTVAAYLLRVIWVAAVTPPGATIHEVWVPYTQMPSFLVFFVLGMTLARVGDTGSWTGRRAALATVLGDLSYGTYLLHPIVWIVSRSALVTIVITPMLALAFHRYELPVQRWLRRRLSGPRHRTPEAQPPPELGPQALPTLAP